MKAEYVGYFFLAIAVFRFIYRLEKKSEYNAQKTCESAKRLLEGRAYNSAIELLTKALEYHKYNPLLYICRGDAYFALKQHKDAIDDYTYGIAYFSVNKNRKLYYTNKDKATKELNEYNRALKNREQCRLEDDALRKERLAQFSRSTTRKKT